MDSAGAIITGELHWVPGLVCPASSDESGSLCLTTGHYLTQRINLWGLETMSLPKKLPGSSLSFMSASCEDSRVAMW